MTENLSIRDFSIEDKPKLIALLKLNVPKYFDESEIADFERYLDTEIEWYFVAELNNEIIGAGGINFTDNYGTAKISWDFIHPEYQGIGLGKKLLNHRIELLKTRENLSVISVRTSQLAYVFYEKNGFVLKNIQKDYWAPGFDLYQMVYEK